MMRHRIILFLMATALTMGSCTLVTNHKTVVETLDGNETFIGNLDFKYDHDAGTIELINQRGIKCVGQWQKQPGNWLTWFKLTPEHRGGPLACADGRTGSIEFEFPRTTELPNAGMPPQFEGRGMLGGKELKVRFSMPDPELFRLQESGKLKY